MMDAPPPISQIRASTIMYCYDELVKACERGDLDEIRRRLPWTIPTMNQGYPLSMAALFGHVECVKELLTHTNMTSYAGRAMQYAAPKDRHACVELLAPWADDESFEHCYSLAARYGHIETLNILLQYNTNPSCVAHAIGVAAAEGQLLCLQKLLCVRGDEPCFGDILRNALVQAVSKEHVSCVKELLVVVGPWAGNSQALLACFKHDVFNEEIFKLLFSVSDAKIALQQFVKECGWETERIEWLGRRIERETLQTAVDETTAQGCEQKPRKI